MSSFQPQYIFYDNPIQIHSYPQILLEEWLEGILNGLLENWLIIESIWRNVAGGS